MTNFQNFDELQELLAGYVLGDLTPEEVAMVNQLLETRPELKIEVNHLQNSKLTTEILLSKTLILSFIVIIFLKWVLLIIRKIDISL